MAYETPNSTNGINGRSSGLEAEAPWGGGHMLLRGGLMLTPQHNRRSRCHSTCSACTAATAWCSNKCQPSQLCLLLVHCVQVKSMYVLSHPIEAVEVESVQQHNCDKLLQVWESLFAGHPWWAELRTLAAAGQYDEVAAALTMRFD